MWLTMMVIYSVSYSILITIIARYTIPTVTSFEYGAMTFLIFLLSLILGNVTASLFHEFDEKVG